MSLNRYDAKREDTMSSYRLTVTVTNARLKRAMESCGIKNAAELSRLSGVSQSNIGLLINLKKPARLISGEWRLSVKKICSVLAVEPDELFDVNQQYTSLEKNQSYKDISHEKLCRIQAALSNLPSLISDGGIGEVENQVDVSRALKNLRPREKSLILERFFKDKSLSEIADDLNVSYGMAKQIEAKALRKLRGSMVSEHVAE